MLDTIRRDIGYALRGLRHRPGFTVTAALTVAIGIAGPSLIFSMTNWLLLRPVAGIADPTRVGAVVSATFDDSPGYRPTFISFADYSELGRSLTSIDLAGHQPVSLAVATDEQPARALAGEVVTASYLPLLGVRIAMGRTFGPADDVPGTAAPVAIISERAWTQLFARDPDVLRRTVRLNGRPFSIIGIVAGDFTGTLRTDRFDIWIPGAANSLVNPIAARASTAGEAAYYHFVARLRPGMTWAQARTELGTAAAWLLARDPERNGSFKTATLRLDPQIGHPPFFRSQTFEPLALMFGGTVILLLVACSNVAAMLLVRGTARRAEMAIRRALGSGTFALIRQQTIEGLAIWSGGGAVALLIVIAVTRFVGGWTLMGRPTAEPMAVPVDWRVVAFTAALAMTTGLLSTLYPAFKGAHVDPATALQHSGPGHTGRNRAASVLTIVQLSACLALLVGALLLTATLRQLAQVELGFTHERVHTLTVNLRAAGYRGAPAADYIRQLVATIAAIPGVDRVAAASRVPLGPGPFITSVKPVGTDNKIAAQSISVLSEDFFETIGIRLTRGRTFSEQEVAAGAARDLVVLSERLARQIFGDEDPVGRVVEYWSLSRRGRPFEVIGVVRDAQLTLVTGEPEIAIYELPDVRTVDGAVVMVRTSGDAVPRAAIQAAAAALDPDVPTPALQPLTDTVDARRGAWTILARLMSVLALVATLLACVGLGALISAGVIARSREVGIRVALGATPGRVVAFVMRCTILVTAAGLLIGSAAGAGLGQILRNRLVGVGPFDLWSWGFAVAGVIVIAVVASWLPVRRAVRLDVTRTLRV